VFLPTGVVDFSFMAGLLFFWRNQIKRHTVCALHEISHSRIHALIFSSLFFRLSPFSSLFLKSSFLRFSSLTFCLFLTPPPTQEPPLRPDGSKGFERPSERMARLEREAAEGGGGDRNGGDRFNRSGDRSNDGGGGGGDGGSWVRGGSVAAPSGGILY